MEYTHSHFNQKIRFWALLGPFLTLLIFSVYLIKLSHSSLLLAIMALAGLICCWRWRMKGLLIAIGLIIGMMLVNLSSVPISERFWFLGLAMATALSFVVTVLSYEEIEMILKGIFIRSEKLQAKIDELNQSLHENERKKEMLVIDCEWLKEQKKDFEHELENKKQIIQQLENEKLDKVQQFAEKYQVKTSDKPRPDHNYQHLYLQLRNQFSEKGEILDQTRKELFAAQEKVACLKRDLKEITEYCGDDVALQLEKECMTLCQELETQNKMYKEEIEVLEQLVESLLQQN